MLRLQPLGHLSNTLLIRQCKISVDHAETKGKPYENMLSAGKHILEGRICDSVRLFVIHG
jgi:hypothetical protein